jgi:hypothetical protein
MREHIQKVRTFEPDIMFWTSLWLARTAWSLGRGPQVLSRPRPRFHDSETPN